MGTIDIRLPPGDPAGVVQHIPLITLIFYPPDHSSSDNFIAVNATGRLHQVVS
jgi:hypothetical protein